MKIALFTNTYLPHVGGVARSIHTLESACRAKGHEVCVVAPEFDGAAESPHVLRVPAIQNFNGSDFCVRLPLPNVVRDFIEEFQPDIIHSNHPFLLGDAALREAWKMRVPIVFTHHTLYERYTHYVPMDSPALKRVAIQMATEYCNLCEHIIAPSESIAHLLRERAVTSHIEVIPTGIDIGHFASGDGADFRRRFSIPADVKVVGHVGRLAKEKNLIFLAQAVAECLKEEPGVVFLLVGEGDACEEMKTIIQENAGEGRVIHAGKQTGQDLADAYAAMDWFVFASQTETQGIVLAEAMAAGKPVVALDGPGVREIVHPGENGFLLNAHATSSEFAAALKKLIHDDTLSRRFGENAREVVREYDTDCCVERMLACYEELISRNRSNIEPDPTPWDRMLSGIQIEWELLAAKMAAATAAIIETPATEASLD